MRTIIVKYAQTFAGFDDACKKALEQVKTRKYGEKFRNEGRDNIIATASRSTGNAARLSVKSCEYMNI